MGQRSAAVDAYIRRQPPFAKPILGHLRELVHEACPEAVETIKWGQPHFEYKGLLAGMGAFKAHAVFGFWKHALLAGERVNLGRSQEKAMWSFGRLTSVADLPPRRTMLALVRRAMKLNDDGVKHPARSAARRPVVVRAPAYFLAAVRRDRRALATWEALPPGHRREYVEWVTEAKREETRGRRLETTVRWLAEGKRHNWKYAPPRGGSAPRPARGGTVAVSRPRTLR